MFFVHSQTFGAVTGFSRRMERRFQGRCGYGQTNVSRAGLDSKFKLRDRLPVSNRAGVSGIMMDPKRSVSATTKKNEMINALTLNEIINTMITKKASKEAQDLIWGIRHKYKYVANIT